MTHSPLVVTVYDKLFNRKGTIGDASVTATVRHNLMGTAEIRMSADHPRAADVLTKGSRIGIDYDEQHLMCGVVFKRHMQGPGSTATLTATIHDDWRLLTNTLGWPLPGSALNSQTVAMDFRGTAPAETVVKAVVAANAARLGLPVTIAPDLGRGQGVRWSWRFHPLLDRMALETSGIGVTIRQSGAGYLVDCYTPQTYPRTLTEASGVVQDWEWTLTGPTATRVIAGNQGEATARVFVTQIDTGLEAEWGDKIEVFRDARDTSDTVETAQRMSETLAEGAPTTGLSVTLSETDTFRYGMAVRVGDVVTLEVGPGLVVTDVLREATLKWSDDDGLLVTPVIGDMRPPESLLPRALAALRRQVQTLSRS